jgi:hypothetical protein
MKQSAYHIALLLLLISSLGFSQNTIKVSKPKEDNVLLGTWTHRYKNGIDSLTLNLDSSFTETIRLAYSGVYEGSWSVEEKKKRWKLHMQPLIYGKHNGAGLRYFYDPSSDQIFDQNATTIRIYKRAKK